MKKFGWWIASFAIIFSLIFYTAQRMQRPWTRNAPFTGVESETISFQDDGRLILNFENVRYPETRLFCGIFQTDARVSENGFVRDTWVWTWTRIDISVDQKAPGTLLTVWPTDEVRMDCRYTSFVRAKRIVITVQSQREKEQWLKFIEHTRNLPEERFDRQKELQNVPIEPTKIVPSYQDP